ncbi:glycine oxidase ThiO [Paenibacillus sp. 1P07SE]|uniref:glycine oxidase ThiO n=1 Tax=Paenibacillus sp. 1P07SE TaxID=3132209 RepID=UPI0039A41E13
MSKHILVVGGGVIGLSTAFEAARRGHRVTLLEQGRCGGQASGAAAGMLAPFSENGEGPDDFFLLCLASLRLYPDWQQAVKDASGLTFEYSNSGSLNVVYHDSDLLALAGRAAWQQRFGSPPEIVQGAALRALEPALSTAVRAALYHPDESHIYAPDYVRALEAACRRGGVRILERLGEVRIGMPEDERAYVTDAQGQIYEGDCLVICNGAWAGALQEPLGLQLPVYPIRGQICAYELAEPGTVRHMVFGSQGYVVPKANGTLVCGASEDVAGFDTSVTERGIGRLLNWNHRLYPFLEQLQPYHRWAGLRPATQDGYPLLGKLPGRRQLVMAAGHYRNGILLSPVTAQAAIDLIEERTPRVSLGRFAPERFSRLAVR